MGGRIVVTLLQRALQRGPWVDCPWDESTCIHAAEGGYLEVLQWAREHGCAWQEDVCTFADVGGHLEVLKWAAEHGCRWSAPRCARMAHRNGHLEVAQWASAQYPL